MLNKDKELETFSIIVDTLCSFYFAFQHKKMNVIQKPQCDLKGTRIP